MASRIRLATARRAPRALPRAMLWATRRTIGETTVGQRVLVIEDEPHVQQLLEFFLEGEGFEVSIVGTGGDALALLDGSPPSAVVLDVMLPHVDGVEILRRIRAHPPWESVPVLMLTAKGDEEDVVGAFDAGADDFVTKPFQLDALVARLRRLLRSGPAAG